MSYTVVPLSQASEKGLPGMVSLSVYIYMFIQTTELHVFKIYQGLNYI